MDKPTFTAAVRLLHADTPNPLRLAWRHRVHAERAAPTSRRRPARWRAVALLGAVASVLGLGLAGAGPARADDGVMPARVDGAAQAFRERRFAQAYADFVRRADAGDTSAALPALAMARHGPALFDSAWSATPGQLRRWTALALADLRSHTTQITDHDRGE